MSDGRVEETGAGNGAPSGTSDTGAGNGAVYDNSGRPMRSMSITSSIMDCEVMTQDADMVERSGNIVFRQSLLHGYSFLAKDPALSNLQQDGSKSTKRRISVDEPPELSPESPDDAPMFTPFKVSAATSGSPEGSAQASALPDGMARSPRWANSQNSILLTLIDSYDQTSGVGKVSIPGSDKKFEYVPYISTLFHSEDYCQSLLRKVPFINSRSGTKGMIDYVWLRSEWYLAGNFCASKQQLLNHMLHKQQSASDLLGTKSGRDKPTVASNPAPSPYRNLHQKPSVHLYFVSCDTVDHYRTKVKPALIMFDKVCSGGSSGIGGENPISPASSAANTPTNSTHGADPKTLHIPAPHKEPYLIVYVPKGQKPGLVGSVFGGHRHHSSGSNASGLGSSGSSGSVVLPDCATTKEREVFKRLCADFTSQKVCMLSALPHFITAHLAATATAPSISTPPRGRQGSVGGSVGSGQGCVNLSNTIGASAPLNSLAAGGSGSAISSSASGSSSTLDIFSQEWSAMLEKLGNLIATSFSERNKSYLAELKRLEQLKLFDSLQYKWADTEYWLVKESMALSYQQFRLYREALVSYEELSAWIPSQSSFVDKCLLISVPGDEEEGPLSTNRKGNKDDKTSAPSSPTKVSASAELQEELESLEKSTLDLLEVEREAMTARLAASNDPDAEAEKRRQLIQKGQELLWQYANAGDTDGFRRVLTSFGTGGPAMTGDLPTPVDVLLASANSPLHASISLLETVSALQLHQYTFLRIFHILVLLHKPVDILARSSDFVTQLYKLRCSAVSLPPTALSQHVPTRETIQKEAEVWALSTVWDIKCACESYHSFSSGAAPPPSGGPSPGLVARGTSFAEQEREASRYLSQLLEFARVRLVKLGDLELAPDASSSLEVGKGGDAAAELNSPRNYNPIRRAASNRAAQTLKDWVPWAELSGNRKMKQRTSIHSTRSVGTTPKEFQMNNDYGTAVSSVSGAGETSASFLANAAMTNSEAFEDKYLELSDAIVALFDQTGHRRFASRLLGDQAEIYMSRGEYAYAAGLLEEIVDTVAKDGWHGLLFYRLFRLACCQRAMLDAPNYLQTLVKSFHPRFAPVAPRKVAGLFQSELEVLVQDDAIKPDVREGDIYNHGMCPFLEMEMSIETSSLLGRKTHPLGYLRKKVIRHMCPAGEPIDVNLTINCHLPREIKVDSLRLFLMRADDFEQVYRTTGVLQDGVHFRMLQHNKEDGDSEGDADCDKVTLRPGKNVLTYRWIPMTVGQYVISSLNLRWGFAHFSHDCVSLRKAIQGIDVLPSDPTQKVVLNPLFLIPGEAQEIRLAFSSNEDLIVEGAVELTCSEGLKVLPPGTEVQDTTEDRKNDDSWSDRCVAEITSCGLHQTQYIKAWVKSDPILPGNAAQTLHARVRTNYHHALYEDVIKGDEPEAPPMSATLDASVTTLGRPALTVHTAEAYSLANGVVLVSISLLCNTPVPFFIKKWEAVFPPPLELKEDPNDLLADHPVAEGQEIFFAFSCRIMNSSSNASQNNVAQDVDPTLVVILRNDEGKTFRQVLPLDLVSFYEQMMQEIAFSGKNMALAELTISAEEGQVGSPVKFTYTVDVSSLSASLARKNSTKNEDSSVSSIHNAKENASPVAGDSTSYPLLYSVICDQRFWILAGKVGGVVPVESGVFTLDFIGIPSQPGVQKHFPKMKLFYPTAPNESPAPKIKVNCRVPESFVSLAFKNHVAIAAPASIDNTSS